MKTFIEKKVLEFISTEEVVSFHITEIDSNIEKENYLKKSIEVFNEILLNNNLRSKLVKLDVIVDLRFELPEETNLIQPPKTFEELDREIYKDEFCTSPEFFIFKNSYKKHPAIFIPKLEYYRTPIIFKIKDLPDGAVGYYSQYRSYEDMIDNEDYYRWFNITWML